MRETPAMAEQGQHIAIVVSRVGERKILSPFFAKSDGVLVIDRQNGRHVYHENGEHSGNRICEIVARTGSTRVVLGFVGHADTIALRENGVELRLGCCTCDLSELAASFDNLPIV